MKFQLFSDIHLEFLGQKYPKIKKHAEILILAGDIGHITQNNFKDFIKYCSENWSHVLYVFGNHEFYGKFSMESVIQKTSEYFKEFNNVHLLDNSYIILDEFVYYGFTGWTMPIFDNTNEARNYLNDYNKIKTQNGKLKVINHKNIAEFQVLKFKEFIELNLDNIIVITHFPPVKNTSDPIFESDKLNGYFSWNNFLQLNSIFTTKIKCWCSGHTHYSYDFFLDGIRYMSNQIGYLEEYLEFSELGIYEI